MKHITIYYKHADEQD